MKMVIVGEPDKCMCGCSTWIAHWERAAGLEAIICSENQCTGKVVSAICAVKTDSPGGLVLVFPVCRKHCGKPGEELSIMDEVLKVTADTGKICTSPRRLVSRRPVDDHVVQKRIDHPLGRDYSSVRRTANSRNNMTDQLQVPSWKRVWYRFCAVTLAVASVWAGIAYAIQLHSAGPILVALFLCLFSYALWIKTSWTLTMKSDGIVLSRPLKSFFLPWSKIGEFAPGDGTNRHKVEFSLRGEPQLAEAYRGAAQFKLRRPRFLPDTFGMSAAALAELLNRKKAEGDSL